MSVLLDFAGNVDPNRLSLSLSLFIASITGAVCNARLVLIDGVGEVLSPLILGLSILAIVAILGSLSRNNTGTV